MKKAKFLLVALGLTALLSFSVIAGHAALIGIGIECDSFLIL